jgi:hypothetical protein
VSRDSSAVHSSTYVRISAGIVIPRRVKQMIAAGWRGHTTRGSSFWQPPRQLVAMGVFISAPGSSTHNKGSSNVDKKH